MIAVLFGFLTSLAYAGVSLAFARYNYRQEYAKLRNQKVPAVYGHGWMTHEEKRRVALREGAWWLAMWLPFCLWSMIGWSWVCLRAGAERLISGPDPVNAGLDYNKIEELEKETAPGGSVTVGEVTVTKIAEWTEMPTDIPEPCPCGYTTECHIHCGDGPGSCHYGMTMAQDENEMRAVRQVFHSVPGIIRTKNPEKVAEHTACGKIREYDVSTVSRPGVKLYIDDRGHCWEERS